MSIKRYEQDYDGTLIEVKGGSLMKSADHAAEVARLNEQVRALASENAKMREIIGSVTNLDNEPEYHEEGMGCGLEDRRITDRYEAMRHGWDCAMERIYGEVIPCAEELDFIATDAILNELRAQARAQGIHFAANRLLAAWESGFVDDTPAMAHDISGAVLSAVEFLPNADEAEFKRDYADEVRARIRKGQQP